MSRSLTIDQKWQDWKFGDTDAVMTTTPLNDDQMPDFTGKTLTFKIASTANNDLQHPQDFAASAPGYVDGKNVQLKTEDIKQLTPGTYVLELWVFNNKSKLEGIYPSKGFASFTIEENTMGIADISNVSSLTLNAFWNALVQKLLPIKQGPKGDPGITPKLGKVTVTMLAAGQSPAASLMPNTDTPNTYDLVFQIPIGAKGDKGDPGVPGAPGGQGLPGKDGLTPKIDDKTGHWILGNADTGVVANGAAVKIGTVTTGKPTDKATVTNSGDDHDAVLDFTIPQGKTGETGPAGTVKIGKVTTGKPTDNASVTNSGDDHNAVLDITIPQGATGEGTTVKVGKVTTVEPGQQATVTNSGDDHNAVLNFAVPQGQQGFRGPAGKDFEIKQTFDSVAAMNDSKGAGFDDGDFTMIVSDTQDPDNAKLYVWDGKEFKYIGDLPGAQGIKGDTGLTPTLQINAVTKLAPDAQPTVSYTPVKDKDGNIVGYTVDYGVPQGEQGLPGKNGENGKDGKDGKDGAQGAPGQPGKTPVKGTDYWTDADKQAIQAEDQKYIDSKVSDAYAKAKTDIEDLIENGKW